MKIPLLTMPMMTSQILKLVDLTKAQKSRYLESEMLFFLQIKKMGFTNPCTHLHLAHFSLHPPLYNIISVIRTKIFSILTESWHTWSLGGAALEITLRFLKF